MRYIVLILSLICSLQVIGSDTSAITLPDSLQFLKDDSVIVERSNYDLIACDSSTVALDSVLSGNSSNIIVLNILSNSWYINSKFKVVNSLTLDSSLFSFVNDECHYIIGDSIENNNLFLIDTSQLDSIDQQKLRQSKIISNTSTNVSIPYELSSSSLDKVVTYSCEDSIVFDMSKEAAQLYGTSKVDYDKIDLASDQIIIDWGKNRMEAIGYTDSLGEKIGEPVFSEGNQTIYARRILYNYNTEKGNIYDLYTVEGEGYFQGEKVRKNPNNEMLLRNGRYTTCPCEKDEEPKFYLNMSKVKIIPEKAIIAGPSNLVIEGIPTPLVIPFGLFPMQKGQATGVIIPQYGNSNAFGYYLRNGGYYLGINDKWDMKFLGDIYAKGKWQAMIESRYLVKYKYRGDLSLRYGVEPVGDKYTPDYGKSNDFLIKWNHSKDRKNRPTVGFRAAVEFGTNNYHQMNSIDNDEFLKNNMNSSVSFSKKLTRSKMNFSATLKHRQSRGSNMVAFSSPHLNLNTSRYTPFKNTSSKLLKPLRKLNFQYTSNFKNDISIPDTVLYKKLMKAGIISNSLSDATLELGDDYYNQPINWGDYSRSGLRQSFPIRMQMKLFPFNINPSINLTNVVYNEQYRRSWDVENSSVVIDTLHQMATYTTGSFNMQLSTVLYGKKLYKQSAKIRGWKHDVTPSVSFNYTPDFTSEFYNYYDSYYRYSQDSLGNNYDSTEVNYSKYSGIFGSPPTARSFKIVYGINNVFQVKVRDTLAKKDSARNINLIERLRINGNYDFLPDSLNFSDVSLQANSKLFKKKVSITFNSTFDPYITDTLNNKLNQFEWTTNNRLLRMKQAVLSVGTRISQKGLTERKNQWMGALTPAQLDMMQHVDRDYVDFSSPWSISLGYNYRFQRSYIRNNESRYVDSLRITSAVDARFSLKLTPKWNVTGNSSWDFRKKELGYTTFNIHRQMDCWEMVMSWVPFGVRRRYEFTFRVKSKMLQDVKYNKRKNHFDYQDLE